MELIRKVSPLSMPLSKSAFIWSTIIAIMVGLGALLAIVATTLWLVGETRDKAVTVADAMLVRTALAVLQSDTQDAETGQRGFLLTTDPKYLEPYLNALRDLHVQLQNVRSSSIRTDVEERVLLDQLASGIDDKVSELKQTIDLANAGHREEALTVVKTDRGRILMDKIREILQHLITRAEARITLSVQSQSRSIASLFWVTLVGSFVIIVVSGGSVWAVLVYTRQLLVAEREVQALNAGLEQRVKQRTADLDRANQEIQRFAYIVTHDLRAPLVNIMGFTSELEASLATVRSLLERPELEVQDAAAYGEVRNALQEDVPEAIGFIRVSTQKMDRLISGILKLSREGHRTLKPERINLKALLQASAASVQHQVSENGGEIAISAAMLPIVSDRGALEQIFGNVLENAVKYRSNKRRLQIDIQVRQETGRRIVVEIQDNGRGIAGEDLERVFDLFRRSGPQDQPGEGIGLAYVRTIIRNLGGDISLRSRLDHGTTTIINLPCEFRKNLGTA